MFWRFFIGLFIISLIFPFIFTFLLMPLGRIITPWFSQQDAEVKANKRKLGYILIGLFILSQLYIIGGWCAYVVSRIVAYTSSPEASHKWLYYVVGGYLCCGILAFMGVKGRSSYEDSAESCFFILIIFASVLIFVIFSIWPHLMSIPYGWFLRLIYG